MRDVQCRAITAPEMRPSDPNVAWLVCRSRGDSGLHRDLESGKGDLFKSRNL